LITNIRSIYPQLPILVVSGKLNADLINDLQEMAIDFVLPKPIKPMEFRKIINQLFPDQIYS
ncbi:MAG: response regulator, partial [Calditrichaeota bacterium]|nr:response regulator [Calditrichota bacterium]